MARTDILQPYVEKVLKEVSGNDSVEQAPDGTYGFRWGSAGFRVRLVDADPPLVGVFSVVLTGVRKSNRLFERLNEVNSSIYFARIFFKDGAVVLSTELVAETLDANELSNACGMIGSAADHFDTQLQEEFGGEKLGEDPGQDSVDV